MAMRFSTKNLFLSLFVAIIVSSCGSEDEYVDYSIDQKVASYDPSIALKWNNVFLSLERFTDGYRPPVAARTLGYVGLAAYESVVSGMPEYRSIAIRYPGLKVPAASPGEFYHWPTVLNSCYATSLKNFFPTAPATQLFELYNLENTINKKYQVEISDEVFNRSIEYGKLVADAIFEYSKTDVIGHEAFRNPQDKNYLDGFAPGEWKRTAPDFSNPLLPKWGEARTFAITEDDKKIAAPIPYSENPNSLYYTQGKEVQVIVNEIKQGKQYENAWIADFWSDDCPKLTFTPAGRWVAVANQIVINHKADLQKAIVTYAKLGMALGDAGVAAWHEKYRWKVQRPADYIATVFGDKSWKTHMCPNGNGDYYSPPFPAYPSGHATFGGAAAEVFTAEYGYNVAMYDYSHEGRTEFLGKPRGFENFYEMAEENAYSRIPIGVHWRMDSEQGLKLGYKVARKVNSLAWKK